MKRILSVCLSLLFLLTALPLGAASVAADCVCTYDGTTDLYCNLCGCARPQTDPEIVASGDRGFHWTLDTSGTLTVSGYSNIPADAVQNYLSDYRLQIRRLVVENDVTIGDYAFNDCTNLQTADITEVQSVGNYAFSGCTALEWIEMADVRTIGVCAFSECASLKTVFFGNYAYDRTIGDYAFYMCTSLQKVALYSGTTLGHTVFGNCLSLDSVYLYSHIDYTFGKSQTSFSMTVAEDTFEDVTATLWYPPSDRRYDGWSENAVKGAYGGTLIAAMSTSALCGAATHGEYSEGTLTISGVGALLRPQSGFQTWWYGMQESIVSLMLEDGIDYLPSYCFEYYTSLQTIRLPDTLRTLDCNAFNDCSSIPYLVIPASLEQVGVHVYFNRCDALENIYYMGTETDWAAIPNASNMTYHGETVHYLTYMPRTGSCTVAGYEAHYTFEDGFGLYDEEKQPIKSPIVRPAQGHYYDYPCDVDCNTCGLVREAEPHSYTNVYDPDCNVCGETREVPDVLPGDVNGDGKVNVRDLGLLQQHLNGWKVTVADAACDVNADGKRNVRDLGLLQQHLNGWDVELGVPPYQSPLLQGDLSRQTLTVGDRMYDFTATDMDGNTVTLSERLRDKELVVLNFWFANCIYCQREFPAMNEFYAAHSDTVEMLALNPVDTDATIRSFCEANPDLTIPMLSVPRSWADAFSVTGYPTTVVIDKEGTVRAIHVGAMTQVYQWENILNAYS